MSVSKPSKLPIWDINATNIVEPQSTNQSDGWQVDANGIPQKPPFQYHNYMWHTQYKWIEYLDAEKALLQGDNSKTFKVKNAVNSDEALSKGQLLSEIKKIDGEGSGIDADFLGGLNRTSFLRSDTDDIFQGYLTINNPNQDYNTIAIQSSSNKKIYIFNDGTTIKIDAYDYTNSVALDFDIGGNGGNPNLKGIPTVNGNKIWHAGDGLSSLGANGYQKLPSGLIIQWGSADVSAASHTDFTLPISYPTAYQAVVMLDVDNANNSSGIRSHIVSNSIIRLYNVDDGGTYTIRFMAIGY